MKRILNYQIEKEWEGESAAAFLRAKGFSRHILTHLKQTEGGICRNGSRIWLSERLHFGDVLTVTFLEERSSENIVPVPMKLDIVYEDEDLLVIDKPADMPVHPSIHNFDNTLANGLAYYYESRGEAFVYRCITRLDRDTTGLLLVAKNMLSGAFLAEMGKRREIHREYLAIVTGKTEAEGTVDAPIARVEGSVLERCVDFQRGERAVTHYRTLEYRDGYSLVRLKLETGRTHQIRVHMKYIGHPLTGDFLYNPDYRLMDHQALHSHYLAFRHPITGERMEFTSQPPWQGLWEGREEDGEETLKSCHCSM
ncbi:RluA family pseudouridine synthase [Marvinbryantia formatexigens]|nr:RluA family pseudouridine synthase [Marvinbryantia formatexigens]UWO23361.1 RluA family pseudouridine synthase [Marvinbryantia formatexigens DSM 14469]SDG39990.1 23S rRNA pseudouridine1911/1915/1917 synthase [Marvinbryantia formatexigens]